MALELISKLNAASYSTASPDTWVTGDKDGIDPILLGRLAFIGKSQNVKIKINSGYRSIEEQTKLYNDYKAGRNGIISAAKPGTSKHNYRIALDTSTYPLRGWTSAQCEKYGIHKPIKSEGWHVEPIETKNNSNWKSLAPEEINMEIRKIKVKAEGKIVEVNAILYNGENYIRMRDFDDKMGVITVDYDQAAKMPIVKD